MNFQLRPPPPETILPLLDLDSNTFFDPNQYALLFEPDFSWVHFKF